MVYASLILLGIYIVLAVTAKIGRKHGPVKFRMKILRIRTSSEKIFRIVFLCLLIASAAVAIICSVLNRNSGGSSALASDAVVSALVCIAYFCIRDLGGSAERGEVCECVGDCSRCRVQCTTNEKYYGLNADKKK